MHIRLKPWQFLLLIAAAIALFTFGIQRLRYRLVSSNADLVRLLPENRATTFFIDVADLRAGGILQLISSPKTQESDYRTFVQATGFDYIRDLNAVAGNVATSESYFVLRGRFDWNRLERYARQQGGACGDSCVVQTSTPGKSVSFQLLQPDVIAVAIGADPTWAKRLGKRSGTKAGGPSSPIWLRIAPSSLNDLSRWPAPARFLAPSLHSARSLTFSAGPVSRNELQLHMEAEFTNEHVAEAVRNQLEIETKLLKLELAREKQQPSPSDLTGLLTSGTFQLVEHHVVGTWPLHRELLETLQIQ